ncbi:MAG: YicC family protein [Microscillaceae bacterium]|nr:YicC family protein [Microscillaceae bacterium]
MLQSMTGFGHIHFENERLVVVAEIKSLNSKFLDIGFKLPRNFPAEKELELRQLLKDELQRGKINAILDFQYKQTGKPNVHINPDILKTHFFQLQAIAQSLQAETTDIFRLAALMPDVIHQDLVQEDTDEGDWEVIKSVFKEAVMRCQAFRQDEGQALTQSFEENIQKIAVGLEAVVQRDPFRAETIKTKLQNRMQEIASNDLFDPNRFEQEMIYYLERLDIAEEKIRLRQHLDYFVETLRLPEGNGKKLNFISQEIGREINTIGSKANDAIIQRLVVEMKEELDKIKEQVLNIL